MITPLTRSAHDPAVDFGEKGVEGFLNESLKRVVTAGLQEVMKKKPDNPVAYLANYVKQHASCFKEDAFTIDLGANLVCNVSNLYQKQRRGVQVHKQVGVMPLFTLEAPTALDLQRAIDATENTFVGSKRINIIVEPPVATESLVFCLGAPYLTNLPAALDALHRQDFLVAAAAAQGQIGDEESVTLTEAAHTKREPQQEALDDATKRLLAALGRQRRPQLFSDIRTSLTSKTPLHFTVLPVAENAEETLLYDVLDETIGLQDKLEALSPTILVSFRQHRVSQLRRIVSICTSLIRPYEELQKFEEVKSVIDKNLLRPDTFLYEDFQDYWNKVLDNRDRRDKARIQKENERRQALHDARVAAALEAAAAAEAAEIAKAEAEGKPFVPHPPLQDSKRNGSKSNLGNHNKEGNLQLPPLPPPDPAEVEKKKHFHKIRANRRQAEDSAFIETTKKTRLQCIVRIQRLFRRWKQRARRALMEQELKQTSDAGLTVRPELEAYRELQQEPPYIGSALVRKAQHRLRSVHGTLFSTLPPPPPIPPQRKKYFMPKRSRIPAHFEDDVSSEEEAWVEHVTVIPDKSQLNRSVFFNALTRLRKCDDVAGNELLLEAQDIQSRFCGVGTLQRRAYRQTYAACMDLFHVAFVELAHRGLLPDKCTTFTDYMNYFHKDVFTWRTASHVIATTTAMTGDPDPLVHGPIHPLQDRLLYISLEPPRTLPWNPTNSEDEASLNLRVSGGIRYLTRVSKHLYFAPEYLDRNRWVTTVHCLVDEDKHEKITWFSVSKDPFLYLNGRAFVAAPRPEQQAVDGVLKHLTLEPTVVQRNKIVQSCGPQSPVPAGKTLSSPTGIAASVRAAGPRFSKSSVSCPTPQEISFSPATDGALPLSGSALRTHNQFGVSITEWENVLRVDVHQAATARHGLVSYCASPSVADLVSKKDAQVSAVLTAPVTTNVQSSYPSPPVQLSLTVPNSAAGSSTAPDAVLNSANYVALNPESTDMVLPISEDDTAPSPSSPIRLGSVVFFEGYFTDSFESDNVVTRDWNLNPKHDDVRTSSNSMMNGNLRSSGEAPGSFAKSGDAGGRSLRKKLGSRGNLETQSRKSMLDLKNAAGGGNAGANAHHMGTSSDPPPGLAAGGRDNFSATNDPVPVVATPHQEAASVGSQDTLNKYQFEFVRVALQQCAGSPFLNGYEYFLQMLFEESLAGACVVIAMPDEEALFMGATAAIVEAVVASARGIVLNLQSMQLASSIDIGSPGVSLREVPTEHQRPRRLEDIVPSFASFLDAVFTNVSSKARATIMMDFETTLGQSGISNTIVNTVAALKEDAEQGGPQTRRHIRRLCQRIESYCWLVLVHVFLNEISSSPSAFHTDSNRLPSFAAWVAQPKMSGALRWMVNMDPWTHDESPDRHHHRYSNMYRRWTDDRQYISVAY